MHVVGIHPAEVFQALADPTRLRIVRLFAATEEECCLCELVDSLLEPQYKLSRHLKVLKQAGLLTTQKDGRWVYHRLVAAPSFLRSLWRVVERLPDDGLFAADLKRFRKRMRLRDGGRCRVGIQTPELAIGGL